MNRNELKNNIFSKLTGEGGLRTDFSDNTGGNKGINIEMIQILSRILRDEAFFNVLANTMIDEYKRICSLRGISIEKSFDKVMTPYECSMLARYYGKMMLENEHLSKDSRGR